MTNTVIILCGVIALLIGLFAAYLFWAQRRFGQLEAAAEKGKPGNQLQLAAYERLTLFTERSRLPNLVNRLYDSSLSARQMQQTMLSILRDEYEHNITQQLYVRPEVWEAVTKMKDQNAYIINQLAHMLPANASALDLNKRILDFDLHNPDSTMNNLVLNAIQFEVKKLI